MARKRKSSEMEPPRESMPGPEDGIGHEPNGKELDEQFARFCRDAHLTSPHSTPNTRSTGEIQKLHKRLEQLYRFLYWRNPLQLQQEENTFFRSVLSTANDEKHRLELINERLENVRTTTPHRGTSKHSVLTKAHPASSLPTVDEFIRPDPPSPTRTRRAANIEISSQIAAQTKKAANPKPRASPTAGPSSSRNAQLPPIKNHFAVTKQALLKAKSAPVDTSFATDATKSFGAPPIFSQSTQSGTQLTAATELSSDDENYYSAKQTVSGGKVGSNQTKDSEEDMKRASTHYYSSLAPSEARSLIAAAQKLESSQDTVRRIPRTSHATSDSPRGSQLWGSSIDTSQADFLQARADSLLEEPNSCVPGQSSYVIDGRADSPKRLRLEQNNNQLITPSDDEVEQQAVLPPLAEITPHRFSPADSFAQFKIPEGFAELPFELQWEAQRVLQARILQPEQLEQQWHPRNLETLYRLVSVSNKPFRQGFSVAHSTSWEKVTLNAKLEYAKSRSVSLFDMILQPPNRGDDCALQRKFGNQNVLYVDIPNLNKPPVELKGRRLATRFYDMALQFQYFLGRKWFLYLTQAHKKKKKADPEATKAGTSRLMFIAVDSGFTMTDVLAYLIPYKDNSRQAARKLYSRFELAASSTTPVYVFAPEDVQIVGDQLASTDAADLTFLDPALASRFDEPAVSARVMNDGCCEIHPWVMWQATLALGGTELKTALQARFGLGMAKGIWYRGPEAPLPSLDERPPGPLIRISNSQIKVKHSSLHDLDSHGLTLNVVKANSDVRSSILHIGFLPILLDRGVPKQDLIELVREQVQNDMDEVETALKSPSPMPLRYWMHRRHELWEERNRTGGISTVAGFPVAREERIVQMLESGVVPSQDAFLASEVRAMLKMVLDTKKKNFKIPLSRSTTLLGAALADPLDCLAPGEIHVNFARPFHDKLTGMVWPMLHKLACLIARNPAMAPWDMQKVNVVFKAELAHLPNMVILSTKGKRPLAEVLQGGDYDGDTFWLCWEPKLVEPFRNHPAPWDPPPLDFFGIKKDTKLLCDYVKQPTSDSQWLKWLADMAETRMRFNLLGVVTKLHERLIYLEGGIRSKKALYLVHLHDYLVDADKQGYDFTKSDLEAFKQRIELPTDLPTPAHWEFTKIDNDDEDVYPVHDFKINGNIIDDVFLKVIHPMAQASLSRVHDILRPAMEAQDLSLPKFFNETYISAADDDDVATSSGHILAPREARDLIREELQGLRVGLEEVREFWTTQQKKYTFNDLIRQLRVKYESIMPTHTYHPTVVEWLRRQGNDLTMWEKLRASAFAKFHYRTNTRGKLVWHVAGRELCLLKAHECSQTRTLTMEAWSSLRPRKELKTVDVDDDENTPEIIEDNDEDCVLNEYY